MALHVLLCFQYGGMSASDRGIVLAEDLFSHDPAAPRPLSHHAFTVFVDDETGQMIGYEEVPPTGRAFSPAEKRGALVRAYHLPCTDEQARQMAHIALTLVGRPYAYDACAEALVSMACGHDLHAFGDPARREDCIESMSEIVRGAGMDFCDDVPAFDLRPSQGEAYCVAQHCPRVINWLPG